MFAAKGSVTAGNSSQTSDGAGAAILVSERVLKELSARAARAVRRLRGRRRAARDHGRRPDRGDPEGARDDRHHAGALDWIELNEAFAAQSLAVIHDLGLDPAKINPLGGAIALGHPLGATGAIRTATIVHGLRRRKQKYGMVTMCVGTGMGAAGIFEAM